LSLRLIYEVGRDIINDGKMSERIWDAGKRSSGTDQNVFQVHTTSPFKMPAIPSGCTDQIIDEVTGVIQLAKTGLEFLKNPRKTAANIHESIKSLNKDKIVQMLTSMSGIDNMQAGGDRAKYQGGKYAVQAITIMIGALRTVSQGAKLVKEGGEEMTKMQKFVPDGTTGHPAANALENSTQYNKVVRTIDNEKVVTRNVDGSQEKIVVLKKEGTDTEVYTGNANYDLDEFNTDVLQKGDPDDIIDLGEDVNTNTYYKTQQQKFKDGKDFERNVTNDPAHKSKVEVASGINLSAYTRVEQVQIKLPDGTYFVADNVWYKSKVVNGEVRYDLVINETKLSTDAPFTQRQGTFLSQLSQNPPNVNFELRSVKFGDDAVPFPAGAKLDVQAYLKTVGDGTPGITNYTVIKIP